MGCDLGVLCPLLHPYTFFFHPIPLKTTSSISLTTLILLIQGKSNTNTYGRKQGGGRG